MNEWQCDFPGCKMITHGVGGAIGLLAIGWSFTPGTLRPLRSGLTFCPYHRRDIAGIQCREPERETPCVTCAAIAEATRIQALIGLASTAADCGETKPTNLNADLERLITWEEWYEILWQIKNARAKQDHITH